jgi:glycosyltransferase involved in cell wall biosynthesis
VDIAPVIKSKKKKFDPSCRVKNIVHLIHSLDPKTGGVHSAVELFADPNYSVQDNEIIIAHGLWQWPGRRAKAQRVPYLLFPHGMLDPWFKNTYFWKHLKKQLYWWYAQGAILRDAYAVCFTTEEERRLAQNTFFPYRPAREIVTGIGVPDPPSNILDQKSFLEKFTNLQNKPTLLYLGRIHPKKGLDLLIHLWKEKQLGTSGVLAIAGPFDPKDEYHQTLRELSGSDSSIHWLGMLEGPEKWGALESANALILPSHQENFGMVVAEACSVKTPVLLTNKVNLWREIESANAGYVAEDSLEGISSLLDKWKEGLPDKLGNNAYSCFQKKLHVDRAAESVIGILRGL